MLNDVEKSKISKLVSHDIEDLCSFFDEIDGIVSLYLLNKEAAKTIPKRAKRKAELSKLLKALKVILDRQPTADLVFSGTEEYEALLNSAECMSKILTPLVEEKSACGPEPDDRNWLVGRLADLFAEATGRIPTITWDEIKGEYSGEFYEFCWIVFPCSTDTGIGKLIQKVLGSRRKEEKQQ